MQQKSTIHHGDDATPPVSSDEESINDSFVARQLSLIIERLAILESRLNHLEGQVCTASQASQVPSAASPRPNLTSESHAAQGVPSSTPVTPRRHKMTRGVQPRSPTHHDSPHHAHVRSRETRSSYQAIGMMQASLTSRNVDSGNVEGPSRQTKRPPNHLSHPNPIISPDQLSQTLARTHNDIYYVVTQGIEPGIYATWPEAAALAKAVGGVWTKAHSRSEALEVYRRAYDNGFCVRYNCD